VDLDPPRYLGGYFHRCTSTVECDCYPPCGGCAWNVTVISLALALVGWLAWQSPPRQAIFAVANLSDPDKLANLELLPQILNRQKSNRIGERQLASAEKFRAAGLLTKASFARVRSREP